MTKKPTGCWMIDYQESLAKPIIVANQVLLGWDGMGKALKATYLSS